MVKRINSGQSGFTLTELITVIVIVGILGAAVVPRFFDRDSFDTRGFYDQTLATLRYAQKVAIAQRRNVCLSFTQPAPSTITLRIASLAGAASACDSNVMSPGGTPVYVVKAPAGVAFSAAPTNFYFDALGRASTAVAPLALGSYNITVDQETGYVR